MEAAVGVWDGYFDDVINDPKSWIDSTSDLLASAASLRSKCPMLDPGFTPREGVDFGFRFLGPLLLLRSCAVECALKATWLKKGNRLGENGKFVSIPDSAGHDLVALARAVDFGTSDDERAVLDRLSLWNEAGRYPTPVNWKKWTTTDSGGILAVAESGEQHRMRFSWSVDNEAEFARLVERLVKALA